MGVRKRTTKSFAVPEIDLSTYHLDTLPDEILKHIISFMIKRSFMQVRIVSRRLGRVTDLLWVLMYKQTWQVPHRLIIIPSHIAANEDLLYGEYEQSPLTPDASVEHYPYSVFDMSTTHFNSSNIYYGQAFKPLMYSCNTLNNNYSNSLKKQSTLSNLTSEERCGLLWKDMYFERCKILNFGLLVKPKKQSNSKLLLLGRSSHKDAEHYTDKGYANIYRNDYMKAVSCFEKAIRLTPSARAFEGLARIYQQYESPPHVIIFTEAALQFNPVNPGELYYLRGKALFGMRRMYEALQDFSLAINFLSVSPVNYHLFLKTSEVYYDRMMTNIDLEFFDQAYSDCEMITKTERYFEGGDCFLKCAKVLFEKKHFEQSERFLSQVKSKTLEYYLLCMQVQCMLGNYEESLKSYRSYESEIQNSVTSSTIQPTFMGKEILLDIGITLIINNYIEEGIEKFTESALHKYNKQFTTLKEKEILAAKQQVKKAALRQINEYERYFDDAVVCPMDIHMAWSFYYFLVGMLYFFKKTSRLSSIMSPITQNEDLKVALTNFTRCITLNPTLSESFYFRALLQCYLLLDLPVQTLCTSPTMNSTTKPHVSSLLLQTACFMSKAESTESPRSRSNYQQVAQKIAVTNLMREALNDVNNALTLVSMSMFEPLSDSLTAAKCSESEMTMYLVDAHLLKAYVLYCFGRIQEALVECDQAIELQGQYALSDQSAANYVASKCYILRAVITKNREDIQRALANDTENRLLSFPSLGHKDLLGVIIYLSATNCEFEKFMS